ncbi:hypothetical protein KM043_016763 [Ampulex compressa]|nr:hypothetical protein KM043_016763 [Ampulex compressa]
MKFCLVLLAAFAAVGTVQCHYLPDFGYGPLHEDIQYFLDLIPMDEVALIVIQYSAQDPEFQDALRYLQSKDFRNLVIDFESIPEVINFVNYLEQNGIYAYHILNMINKMLEIDELVPPVKVQPLDGITGGLAGLFGDIKQHISYDLFIHGYVYKMKTSTAFPGFVEQLKSPNFQGIIDALYANEGFQKLHAEMTKKGVNLRLIEDIMFVVLGITFPTQVALTQEVSTHEQLSDVLREFIDLLPLEAISEIIQKYENDEQVQRAVEYAYSKEFHSLVRAVEALKEYQQLVVYLQNSGLDVFAFIQGIHQSIGMEDYVPPEIAMDNLKYGSLLYAMATGGIKGLVEEIKAVLPIDKLQALYEEKLRTSKVFAEFIGRISSPDFQRIVNEVYTHEIFLEMRSKAKAAGLDLEAIADLLHTMFGLKFPKPMLMTIVNY